MIRTHFNQQQIFFGCNNLPVMTAGKLAFSWVTTAFKCSMDGEPLGPLVLATPPSHPR